MDAARAWRADASHLRTGLPGVVSDQDYGRCRDPARHQFVCSLGRIESSRNDVTVSVSEAVDRPGGRTRAGLVDQPIGEHVYFEGGIAGLAVNGRGDNVKAEPGVEVAGRRIGQQFSFDRDDGGRFGDAAPLIVGIYGRDVPASPHAQQDDDDQQGDANISSRQRCARDGDYRCREQKKERGRGGFQAGTEAEFQCGGGAEKKRRGRGHELHRCTTNGRMLSMVP